MKRLIIICEGPTERDFCNDILFQFFYQKGIYVQAPVIKKSKGGIVHWQSLKNEIHVHLMQNPSAFVTTFIDYYGILPRHHFPKWKATSKEMDKRKRLKIVQDAMKSELDTSLNYRFLPYIQLHEFESLLFSNINVFIDNFEPDEFSDFDFLKETIETFDCPEDINDGKNTAPSKRLEKILVAYDSTKRNQKVILGTLIAEAIGLQQIRMKCTRFSNWINALEDLCNNEE